MLSKVYCFLARSLILLADHRILLDFPQILLTTTAFSFSLSSLVSFAFLFSLVSFAFCFSVCFFFFVLFFVCLKQKIFILIHIRLCGRVSDEKIFNRPISENKAIFFFGLSLNQGSVYKHQLLSSTG